MFHHHPIISSWACVLQRAYPGGLADTIHQLYFDELNRPVRGDLRFDNTPSKLKTDLELFRDLPLGDHWPDADLLPCFQYLYSCKYTRTGFRILVWGCLVNFPIMSICTSGSKETYPAQRWKRKIYPCYNHTFDQIC